jgi:type II secretory pathway component PulF
MNAKTTALWRLKVFNTDFPLQSRRVGYHGAGYQCEQIQFNRCQFNRCTMPVFEYSVRNPSGTIQRGTIASESARKARDQLRFDGLEIESIQPVVKRGGINPSQTKKPFSLQGFVVRHNRQVSWFVRELSTLIAVGTAMVDSLQIAIDQSKGEFRNTLMDIREQVMQGSSLGEAMRCHEWVFGNVLCAMIRVGEQSGSLADVLSQAADFRERRDKLKNRVFSAMLYPCLVFVLSIAVTVFLMTVVVPTLLESLVEMGRQLPWPTLVLKSISDSLLSYGAALSCVVAVSMAVFFVWIRTANGKSTWHDWLLRTPVLGNLIVKQSAARLCLVTGTLLRSGVELVKALEIAEDSVSNVQIRKAIEQARDRISSGVELGAAMSGNRTLPPALVQVFTLGQHTGQLDDLLFRIADDYDQQVNTLADRLTTVMEPILIVGLSLVVGFIMLGTLLPILESGNALSE